MREQNIEDIAISSADLEEKAKEAFERKINSSVKHDFKILARKKIENKEYLKAIAIMTGVVAGSIVLGAGASVLLGPAGQAVKLAVMLEAPAFLIGDIKAIFSIISNLSLSAKIRKELKDSGIEFYSKGLDIYVKQDENYVKYNNAIDLLNIKYEMKREKERERELMELEREGRRR